MKSGEIWHRIIEFDEPVKTVAQASKKVPIEKIVKSIVMVDSDDQPLLAIIPAMNKVSHGKIKKLLKVRDVRLANQQEVLQFSGYPVGGVPPFNNIQRVLLDPKVTEHETCIAGGGDVDKLVEIRTKDIVQILSPKTVDITND